MKRRKMILKSSSKLRKCVPLLRTKYIKFIIIEGAGENQIKRIINSENS
jgi:hypothetical protein